VLDTLKYVKHETNVWLEVTTLLIPGHNDSEQELAQLSDWFAQNLGPDTPLHFTAFHPDFKLLDAERTPDATLQRARRRALESGLKHVYTGNTHDPAGQSSYCSGCGERVIERDGYSIGRFDLTSSGACRFCATPMAGHFEANAGHFGPRRIRLPLHERT